MELLKLAFFIHQNLITQGGSAQAYLTSNLERVADCGRQRKRPSCAHDTLGLHLSGLEGLMKASSCRLSP